jgi:hypothetical protein
MTSTSNSVSLGNGQVLSWADDPGDPTALGGPAQPMAAAPVELEVDPLPTTITTAAPPAQTYPSNSAEFRWWAAAEALRRTADFWGAILPRPFRWHETVGDQLSVELDQGEDFNAFYDRAALQFFHGNTPQGQVVYSGESPDVVSHEFGHAVLDAIRPQLWDAASAEVAAFHESFGDMSAILAALQVPSLRDDVLGSTGGRVDRPSRVSRLAEQLGWAIRTFAPSGVEADCLRNASNAFFYRDPVMLPSRAPASSLSSEPHSFSRVFTGAFLSALAGMFEAGPSQDSDGLAQASQDLGQLLVQACATAPVATAYYSQVAAHMIEADADKFQGKYASALRSAFVKYGILSMTSALSMPTPAAPAPRRSLLDAGQGHQDEELAAITLSGVGLGFNEDLIVYASSEPKRFAVSAAAVDVGNAQGSTHDRAAASFVEDLFRRGRIQLPDSIGPSTSLVRHTGLQTHQVRREGGAITLRRRLVDCGIHLDS